MFESENELTEEYAIRHVYPISGFNMLIAAYAESIQSTKPLDIEGFIARYSEAQYGFSYDETARFWSALKTAPYEIVGGKAVSPTPLSIKQLLDSAVAARKTLDNLRPKNNAEEFEHYRLMAAIRAYYLEFHEILQRVNSAGFMNEQVPGVLLELKNLMKNEEMLDLHFIELNKGYLNPAELKQENDLRNIRVQLLYDRLARIK